MEAKDLEETFLNSPDGYYLTDTQVSTLEMGITSLRQKNKFLLVVLIGERIFLFVSILLNVYLIARS